MVFGLPKNLTTYVAMAAGLILFGLFAKRSYDVGIGPAAQETAVAVGTFGSGIGSVGKGAFDLLEGVGSGISKLFNPLFTLRDLIFPDIAGNQPAPIAATEGMAQGMREMNMNTTMMTPMTMNMMPELSIPAPSGPIGLTYDEAKRAYNQQLVKIGIGNTQTQNQIKRIFNQQHQVRNQSTQIYVNQRNELVRLTQGSASTLLKRGYLKNL